MKFRMLKIKQDQPLQIEVGGFRKKTVEIDQFDYRLQFTNSRPDAENPVWEDIDTVTIDTNGDVIDG